MNPKKVIKIFKLKIRDVNRTRPPHKNKSGRCILPIDRIKKLANRDGEE